MALRALEQELAGVRKALDEADLARTELLAAVGRICDALGVPLSGEAHLPLARTLLLPTQVRELERDALRGGVNRAFAVARSHYGNIDLEALSLGYPDTYQDEELEKLEGEVTLFSDALADKIEGMVLPPRI